MSEHTHAVPQQSTGKPQGMPGLRPQRRPYSQGRRALYGLLWAGWTALLVIGGFVGLFSDQILGGLVAVMLGVLAGWYDFRIWTWQARRLWFLIIW
jgi:hypothetical protein